jgi:hypothetical protein
MDTMIDFATLATLAPRIAEPIDERFRTRGIGILGTVRRDGSPRVSPIEVARHDGRLWVGMMPGSTKLLDVLRDPRVALLTPVSDREDLTGEGKLFGRLEQVTDPQLAAAVLGAASEAAGFDPDDVAGSPMFEVRIAAAAWQHVADDAWHTWSWTPDGGLRGRIRRGALGLPEEVAVA